MLGASLANGPQSIDFLIVPKSISGVTEWSTKGTFI